jgi:hypothetical protein
MHAADCQVARQATFHPGMKNIILLTDGPLTCVAVGDNVYMGTVTNDPGNPGGPLQRGRLSSGYLDLSILVPIENRNFVLWQISECNLGSGCVEDLQSIFRDRFGLSAEEYAELEFAAVIVHFGADLLHHHLFTTNVSGITIDEFIRTLDRQIRAMTNNLPGSPSVTLIGCGFTGNCETVAEGCRDVSDVLRCGLDSQNSEHRHYYDQVLAEMQYRLQRDRGVTGLFPADSAERKISFFHLGDLVPRMGTSGRGYPRASDWINVGRMVWSAISCVLKKRGLYQRVFLGYIDMLGDLDDLGWPAYWTDDFGVEPATVARWHDLPQATMMPACLADLPGATLVSVCTECNVLCLPGKKASA